MNNSQEKYLIWKQVGEGVGHDDWIRYHGLAIAKFLNRTAILNLTPLSPYHKLLSHKSKIARSMYKNIHPSIIKTTPINDTYNPKFFYNWGKINEIMTVKMSNELSEKETNELFDRSLTEYVESIDLKVEYDSKFLIIDKKIEYAKDFYKNGDISRCSICEIDSIVEQLEFSDMIKNISMNIINILGDYDSIHIRRGDIFDFMQYFYTKNGDHKLQLFRMTDISTILKRVKQVVESGRKLYIATNEMDLSLFDEFKKEYNVYFRQDFCDILEKEIPLEYYNTHYIFCIEEEIMSYADKFISTVPTSCECAVRWMRTKNKEVNQTVYTMSPESCLLKVEQNENVYFVKRCLSYDVYKKRIFWW